MPPFIIMQSICYPLLSPAISSMMINSSVLALLHSSDMVVGQAV